MRFRCALLAGWILVVVLLAALAAGCGEEAGIPGGPKGTVERFLEACRDGDVQTAGLLITESSRRDVEDLDRLVEGFRRITEDYRIGSPHLSGIQARVPVTIRLTTVDTELAFDMILHQEGGSWKISIPETEVEVDKAKERVFRDFPVP